MSHCWSAAMSSQTKALRNLHYKSGGQRRENITDWTLGRFCEHYRDETITKWDIFYYVYGLLHHPGYRARYAENLKRELPRIPLAPPLAHARGSDSGTAAALQSEPRASASGSAREAHSDALGYLITFHTYGSWLHGTERGSVDRAHNIPGTDALPPDAERERAEFQRLKQQPVELDARQRASVEKTIEEVCAHRGWQLHAVNVRTNHVHVVVSARPAPEKVMNDFKSYCTRRLGRVPASGQEAKSVEPTRKHTVLVEG